MAQAASVHAATPSASLEVSAPRWSVAAQPMHHAELIQGGLRSSDVQRRRSMRRFRQQQTATAAAVAGALAGVSGQLLGA